MLSLRLNYPFCFTRVHSADRIHPVMRTRTRLGQEKVYRDRVGFDVPPGDLPRMKNGTDKPFHPNLLHPGRRTLIGSHDIIEATAAGDQPAGAQMVTVPDAESLLFWLSKPDPNDVSTGSIDLLADGRLLRLGKIAVTPPDDLKPWIKPHHFRSTSPIRPE